MGCPVESTKKAAPLVVKEEANSLNCHLDLRLDIRIEMDPSAFLHPGINKGAIWYFITEPVNENTSIHHKVNISFEQW